MAKAVNKVVYDNNTLIDITDTTAVESDVAEGKTFYKADGSKGTGTAVSQTLQYTDITPKSVTAGGRVPNYYVMFKFDCSNIPSNSLSKNNFCIIDTNIYS